MRETHLCIIRRRGDKQNVIQFPAAQTRIRFSIRHQPAQDIARVRSIQTLRVHFDEKDAPRLSRDERRELAHRHRVARAFVHAQHRARNVIKQFFRFHLGRRVPAQLVAQKRDERFTIFDGSEVRGSNHNFEMRSTRVWQCHEMNFTPGKVKTQ